MDLLPVANDRCYELYSKFDSDDKLFSYQKNFVEYVCNNHTAKRKYMLMFEAGTGKTYAYIKTVERLIRNGIYKKADIITRAVLHASIRAHIPQDLADNITLHSFNSFCQKFLQEMESKRNSENPDEYILSFGRNDRIYIFDEIQVVLGESAYLNDTKMQSKYTFEQVMRYFFTRYVDQPESNILTIFSTATLMVNTAEPACKFANMFNLFNPNDDISDPQIAANRIVEKCEIFAYKNTNAIKDHYMTSPLFKSLDYPDLFILPVSKLREDNLQATTTNPFNRDTFEKVLMLSTTQDEFGRLVEQLYSIDVTQSRMDQLTQFCNIIAIHNTSIAFIIYNEFKAFLNGEPGYAIAYYDNKIENGAKHLMKALELLNNHTTIRTRNIVLKTTKSEDDAEIQTYNVTMADDEQEIRLNQETEVYSYCLVDAGNAGYFSNKVLPSANGPGNVNGKICNLVLFSFVFREGVSFSNVLRKYYPVFSWNLTSKYQVEYRTLRANSFEHFDISTIPDKYKDDQGKIYPHNYTFCYTLASLDFRKRRFVDDLVEPAPRVYYPQLDIGIIENAYRKQEGIDQVVQVLEQHNNKEFRGDVHSSTFLAYNIFEVMRSSVKHDFNKRLLNHQLLKGIVDTNFQIPHATMSNDYVVMPLSKIDDNHYSTTAPVTMSKGNIITYRSITQV